MKPEKECEKSNASRMIREALSGPGMSRIAAKAAQLFRFYVKTRGRAAILTDLMWTRRPRFHG